MGKQINTSIENSRYCFHYSHCTDFTKVLQAEQLVLGAYDRRREVLTALEAGNRALRTVVASSVCQNGNVRLQNNSNENETIIGNMFRLDCTNLAK